MRIRSIALAFVLAAAATPLFAHCDSMNGPVIAAARAALAKGDVTPVLKWVPASQETEIRDAFRKTLAARTSSPEAREVADRWFFENLVRVHRASEGEPFTGITTAKPAEGIELADAAVDSGSLDAVQNELVASLRERFAAVQEAKKHADASVEDGRRYVRAYVEFIHYVEQMHGRSHDARSSH